MVSEKPGGMAPPTAGTQSAAVVGAVLDFRGLQLGSPLTYPEAYR